MNKQEPEFDDGPAAYQEEWLSAYLDGELTGAQRETVEARLANDPVAQNMLGDLERIRGLVKQLPTWNGPALAIAAEMLVARTESDDMGLQLETAANAAQYDAAGDDEVALALEQATPAEEDVTVLWVPNEPAQSSWRWMRPLTIAASLLLMAGIGYVLWPTSGSMDLASSTRSKPAVDGSLASPAVAGGDSAFSGEPSEDSEAMEVGLLHAPGASAELSMDALPALPMPSAVASEPTRALDDLLPRRGTDRQRLYGGSADFGASDLADSGTGRLSGGEATPGDYGSGAAPAQKQAADALLPAASSESFSRNRSRALNEDAAETVISRARKLPGENLAMAAKPPELRIARSDQWSDSAVANELATNPALAGMQSESNASNLVATTANSSTNDLPASIVLASLPSSEDAEAFFENALGQNGLTVLVNRSNSILSSAELAGDGISAGRVAGQSASTVEAPTLDKLPPATPELDRNLENRNLENNAPQINARESSRPETGELKTSELAERSQVQSIVLFLSYAEAQRMLQSLQEKSPVGSKANYSWIKPATTQAIEAGSRVVLVLNPAAE